MSGKRQPFVPRPGTTVNINVSSSNQEVKITDEKGDTDVRVHNAGTATVWIRFGGTGGTASTTTDMPIPAGAIEVFGLPAQVGALYAQAIAAASTGRIYFTPGEGI